MCKLLTRGKPKSIIDQCFKDTRYRIHAIEATGRLIHRELMKLCKDDSNSILMSQDSAKLQTFSWSNVLDEAKIHCPSLLYLLRLLTITRTPRSNTDAIIGFILSILCKFRRPSMNLPQKIISLILYNGHSSKQV